MSCLFEIIPTRPHEDPRGLSLRDRALSLLDIRLDAVYATTVVKVAAPLDPTAQKRIVAALTDDVQQYCRIGLQQNTDWRWRINIGFRPGVTDNVGRTAGLFIRDLLGDKTPHPVFTETNYYITASADLRRAQVEQIADQLLANALIERITVSSVSESDQHQIIETYLPTWQTTDSNATVQAFALPADPQALLDLSRTQKWALDTTEMSAIRDYFYQPAVQTYRQKVQLPKDPTDVEIEILAQTWSEHCKHKIFAANIDYTDEHGKQTSINSLFKTYIAAATYTLAKDPQINWLVSVFDDNAGVVRLNDQLNLVYKVETHNSPSALDPYGGALTGIVGVNRDPLGTGRGATLLTNVWGYCFASPDYDKPIPEGLLHPRRIRQGVHRGVIDGGNQSGIPMSRGFEYFDPRFLGKPLVFCGTVGLLPAVVQGEPAHQKPILPGDVIVMVGGRIGKDGIHGATFSSDALDQHATSQVVQIGDPITQKMMSDFIIEARDLGLYRTLTDNGAGGLSSSVGELARICGGAHIELSHCPLKYPGLAPWEILLSEAQERMTLAVDPAHLSALMDLARRREVEATAIGHFNDSTRFQISYQQRLVADIELTFLHDGCPKMRLTAQWTPPPKTAQVPISLKLTKLKAKEYLSDIIKNLNLCSKESLVRHYDHEVKGLSVIKPLVGRRGDVASDATVMRVQHGSDEAILLAEGIAPSYSDHDPGAMAAYVVDLAVRRIIAAGGQLGSIAGLDNFCWPDPVASATNPDGPQKLAGLVRSCQSLFDMTQVLKVPLISGKDSMKNDSIRGGVKISIPPTLLFSAIGWIPHANRAIDLVIAHADVDVYLIGKTSSEFGGSALYQLITAKLAFEGVDSIAGQVPIVDPQQCRANCEAVQYAIDKNWITAAHALHQGGIAAGLARLCLANDLGMTIDVSTDLFDDWSLLFSESASRFLVAVPKQHKDAAESDWHQRNICAQHLGTTADTLRLQINYNGQPLIDLSIDELRRHFHYQDTP